MVHRATFQDDDARFREGLQKFKKSALLECFPPDAGNNLLLIFDRPPRTYWSFLNVEAESHNDKEERIKGVPAFNQDGTSEAVIDLYQIPASANEADFKARFTWGGKDWRVRFKGHQIHP